MATDRIYSADWWQDFFAWEPGVQLEFVHAAVETSLGLHLRWGEETWGRIMEQAENARIYIVPQPFDVRHVMVLLCGNELIAHPDGTIEMIDINKRHENLHFKVEGIDATAWNVIEELATRRLEAEFPWAWGWRNNCWARETKEQTPVAPEYPPPETHGKN